MLRSDGTCNEHQILKGSGNVYHSVPLFNSLLSVVSSFVINLCIYNS